MKRLILTAALVALPAFAGELKGVKVPDSITVEGKPVALNGMGVRTKFIVDVYVGSLYLEQTSKVPADILKTDQIRRVEMNMLRDLSKSQLDEAIKSGFEKNAGANLPKLQERLDKLIAKLADVQKGQVIILQYVPGKGTSIDVKGDSYTAEGKDFADALFSVWLGQYPADEGLKKGMLGNK